MRVGFSRDRLGNDCYTSFIEIFFRHNIRKYFDLINNIFIFAIRFEKSVDLENIKIMKKDIHPEYKTITALCACGSTFEIGSVLPELKVEICSACHPFFTGKQKLIDTAGRIEKFQKRFAAGSYASLQQGGKKKKPAANAPS